MRNRNLILLFIVISLFIFGCKKTDEKILDTKVEAKVEEKSDEALRSRYEKMYSSFYEAYNFSKKTELEKKNRGFKLYVAGDIMFHSPQLDAAKKDGAYDFLDSFKYIGGVIEDGLSIANFETTIAESGFMGYPLFRTPKIAVKNLKDVGFDILALANNHSLDGKKDGIRRTKEAVLENEITPLGTYFSDEKNDPIILDVEGRKIAFLNYTYGLNGLDGWLEGETNLINVLDEEKVLHDINYAKENANGIIVMVHWGTEYIINGNDKMQEKWLNFFAENGVDIVLGSHPHVIEPDGFIEKDGHRMYYIFSLGNFLSNQRREYMDQPYGEDGVILEMNIKPYDDKRIYAADVFYHPTWVKRTKTPLKYEIVPVYEGLSGSLDGINEADKAKLAESKDRTLSILKAGKYVGDKVDE
ncbi:MAG: CapA family protein [Ezakiella sp.]|uniref:CapA family protein n=1 Tax=Ezakiella sp. TaxID=1935205 RepID=UPI0029733047|nr:CapA family protein [Ezakiella sp.]MDD7732017.1 CapA family protein [Eubacteriales bacterium]MDY6079884.1 CapA family protein [Ezakiella sp.]